MVIVSRRFSPALALALMLTVFPFAASCTAGPIDVIGNNLWRGLIAHWPLDEVSGTTVADRSGNGHQGTLVGASWIRGQFDGALHFEPGNEVSVPSFPAATPAWTVGLWVRPGAGDLGTAYITLISTELVFSGGWEMNAVLSANERHYQFGYYLGPGDSDYFTHNCACVVPGQWTHIVGVVDGAAGTLRFYRDGLLQLPVMGPPPTATPGAIRPGNSTLYMGRWYMDGRLFRGDLDDVVIFDRALSSAEVAALARNPLPYRR